MQVLAISEKWAEKYGYDNEDIRSIKYLKTKNYIVAMTETEEERKEFGDTNKKCNITNIIELYNVMKKENNFNIMIGKRYFFNERMFCRRNISFEKFIKKTKKYYSNRIKNKKIKNEWIIF
jgi:hypothetical protein